MIKEIFLVSFAILAITAALPADESYQAAVQQLGAVVGPGGPLRQIVEEVDDDLESAETAYRGHGHHGGHHHGGHHGHYGHGHGHHGGHHHRGHHYG